MFSVNADRRPDLRDAIVAGTFQRQPCPSCGTEFRVDPEFTYMELRHGLYIGVWPVAKRGQWQACAEKTAETFEEGLGKGASPEAAKLGVGIEPRAVFGWPALVEKLIARQAGIDDRTLELAKVMALRHGSETPVPGQRELRLVEAGAERLRARLGAAGRQPGRAGDARAALADRGDRCRTGAVEGDARRGRRRPGRRLPARDADA